MQFPPDFSSELVYANRLDLDQLDVFMERSGNEPMFLEVKALPEILTYGKHYGTLSIKNPKGQPYYFRPNTRIQFEVKDSKGTVIFSSLASSNEISRTYDGSLIFYIWVKEDPLGTYKSIQNGMGTLTFVGELTGQGLPEEWSGKPNYRCVFPINLKVNQPNTSPILFQSSSLIQQNLNISESIEIDNNPGENRYKRS